MQDTLEVLALPTSPMAYAVQAQSASPMAGTPLP